MDKATAESLEAAARKLLALPRWPDTATSPHARVLLDQITGDRKALGDTAALKKWGAYCTMAVAGYVTADSADTKAACRVGMTADPKTAGQYVYPKEPEIATKLADPDAAKALSAAESKALTDLMAGNIGAAREDVGRE